MGDVKVEAVDTDDYLVTKVIMDSTPHLGDPTGKAFLDDFENALGECRKAIDNGYRLTDFWSDPDVGVEFVLKKIKKQ